MTTEPLIGFIQTQRRNLLCVALVVALVPALWALQFIWTPTAEGQDFVSAAEKDHYIWVAQKTGNTDWIHWSGDRAQIQYWGDNFDGSSVSMEWSPDNGNKVLPLSAVPALQGILVEMTEPVSVIACKCAWRAVITGGGGSESINIMMIKAL